MLPISLGAVCVAAIANFITGAVLHSPPFGALWMKLANIHPTGKEKFSDMVPSLVKNFVMNLLAAFCLANIIFVTAAYQHTEGSVLTGLAVGFWVWLGFIVTSSSMEVIWMGRTWQLWAYEVCASLVCMLAMGAIIAVW